MKFFLVADLGHLIANDSAPAKMTSSMLWYRHNIIAPMMSPRLCMPRERLFNFTRRPANGSLLLKRIDWASKFDPLVEEIAFINRNPQYDHVKLPNDKGENDSRKISFG